MKWDFYFSRSDNKHNEQKDQQTSPITIPPGNTVFGNGWLFVSEAWLANFACTSVCVWYAQSASLATSSTLYNMWSRWWLWCMCPLRDAFVHECLPRNVRSHCRRLHAYRAGIRCCQRLAVCARSTYRLLRSSSARPDVGGQNYRCGLHTQVERLFEERKDSDEAAGCPEQCLECHVVAHSISQVSNDDAAVSLFALYGCSAVRIVFLHFVSNRIDKLLFEILNQIE